MAIFPLGLKYKFIIIDILFCKSVASTFLLFIVTRFAVYIYRFSGNPHTVYTAVVLVTPCNAGKCSSLIIFGATWQKIERVVLFLVVLELKVLYN